MAEAETTSSPNQKPDKWKLTKVVKKFVDILSTLIFFLFIIMCFVTLIGGVSIPLEPDERHTDIEFQFSFIVNPESVDLLDKENGEINELIRGDGNVKLNDTKSYMGWFLQQSIWIVMLGFAGFALRTLQKLFKNLEADQFFHPDNPVYIKQFGLLVIAWSIVEPLIIYFGGMAILADVGQFASNIEIYPLFYLPIGSVFFGLAVLLLAQIMKEASDMREEQELTI